MNQPYNSGLIESASFRMVSPAKGEDGEAIQIVSRRTMLLVASKHITTMTLNGISRYSEEGQYVLWGDSLDDTGLIVAAMPKLVVAMQPQGYFSPFHGLGESSRGLVSDLSNRAQLELNALSIDNRGGNL